MSMLSGTFDAYGRTARLWPALLTLLPAIVTAEVWTPALIDFTLGIPALRTAFGGSAVLFAFARIARHLGRNAELRLYDQWGGKPTSLWLLRSDHNLDELTKARYRKFLEDHIEGWEAPSQADEESDRSRAMSTYDSAVRWLRERTRDRRQFDLVFKENVSYGFCRNAYGLRWVGGLVALLCMVVNAGGLYYSVSTEADLIPILGIGSLVIISAVIALVWLFAVKQSWVHDAADGYARALLAECDSGRLR